ncbi:hypothetical protein O6H91_22G051900 [Diphasiastrum complanatum]|nr:hypothetical protein O6H91_22G051900 [Diphasiastrum complanatum]
MERAVLDYYASLWNAKWPHDKRDGETYWGFSLTMGSTEANMYAMWNARDYLGGKVLLWEETPDSHIIPSAAADFLPPRLVLRQAPLPKYNPNAYTPVAFYSEDTHYSFAKAMSLIAIKTFYELGMERYPNDCPLPKWRAKGRWPEEVPSEGGGGGEGTIDIAALKELVEFFAAKGYPILVSFNYGSTFKGAYDNVQEAGEQLMPIMKRYHLDERLVEYSPGLFDKRTGFWIHVDGALGAAYMPFIEMAHERDPKLIPESGPVFDFRLPFVHSISMSGHKWVGSPVPCGIFMTKTKYQLSPPSLPEYIGSPDTTFAGSRSGLSPIILWHQLSELSYEDQMKKAEENEAMAQYAYDKLRGLEKKLGKDLWVARSKLALTVRFRQARPDIVKKYSLSNEILIVGNEYRNYSHVFTMNHVTTHLVDALISDLSEEGAFPEFNLSKASAIIKGFTDTPITSAQIASFVPHWGRGYSG